MAVDIKYKGDIVATAESGQTATLKCGGYKMGGDVEVTAYGGDINLEELEGVVDSAVAEALQEAKDSGIFDGKDGKDGTNGVNGKDGADGAKGDKGDKGDAGPKGEKGDHGSGGKPVTDYGAKGDGSTDDTAVFKSALAENRIVFVPGGTYKLTSGITIGDNSCLELAQDAVLEFTNTTGNCITLGMLSNLKGNHATINVPYEFEGNVLYAYSCDCSEAEQNLVPPWTKWCPQWKSGRYVTDVNICKANASGNHASVGGECSGTAVYVSADHTAGLLGYMWGVQYSGLRIAGAFSYGIRCVNFDEGWLHEIRMDAFIDACEIGVSLEDCNNAYISAIVQPRATWHSDVTKRIKYAKHGIQLIRSKNADLSGSRVWDWNSDNSLWTDGGEWQSYAMYGDCGSAIISDFAYYSTSFDIRNRIYTDTLENFDRMTILQEPIDKWFKVKRGEPYYSTGEFDKKLVTDEMLANHFTTDVVKKFTDVFPTALDDDGEVCGGVGYKNGYIAGNGNIGDTAYYVVTGFIPIASGQTLYVQDMSYASYDGYCRVNLYDANKTLLRSIASSSIVGGSNWHVKYVSLPSGFSLTANGVVDNESVAYVRFSIYKKCLGDYPMASIGEPIEYTVEGFLADGVKVKGENVIGDIGVGQPDWVAKQKLTEGASVWTEREVDFKGTSYVALSDFGGGFKANNGVEYDVYWDGERYECIAKESNEGLYLGNGNLVFGTAEENTGEPFCLYASFLAPDTIFYIRKTGGTPDVLKVKVTHRGYVEYDKMPVEYLPDEVALKKDIPSVGGSGIDVTAEVGQTIVVEEVDGNGKPTKWKAADFQERTHWTEVVQGDLVPHMAFTPVMNEAFQMLMYNLPVFDFEAGKTYTVIFDGVEYTGIAEAGVTSGIPFVSVGNTILHGVQSAEPFIVVQIPAMSVFAVVCFTADAHTIQVIGEKTVHHKIPDEYVRGDNFKIILVLSATGGATYTASATFEEIIAAVKAGKNVFVEKTNLFDNGDERTCRYNFVLININDGIDENNLVAFLGFTNGGLEAVSIHKDGTVSFVNL